MTTLLLYAKGGAYCDHIYHLLHRRFTVNYGTPVMHCTTQNGNQPKEKGYSRECTTYTS